MIDFIDYTSPYTTIIDENTVVSAQIKTLSSIEVKGKVYGNIEAEGLTSVYGEVEGTIHSKDFIARENSQITGNLEVVYDVLIQDNSNISGNIKCKNIEIMGQVIGDIQAEKAVIIRGCAVVLGNINCHCLVVDEGAKINGNVKLLYQFER